VVCAPAAAEVRSSFSPGGKSIGGGLSGFSASSDASDPATITSQFAAATKERPAVLMITVQIAPGWHVYSITQPPGGPQRAKIDVTPSPQYRMIGEFDAFPEPTKHIDQVAWVGLEMQEHENQVTWYAPIELAADVDPASVEITGSVKLQVCKDSCVPVNTQFAARLGPGVPIGPIHVDKGQPVPVVSSVPSGMYQAEGSEVKLTGALGPSVVAPGGTAILTLTATPANGWHIYAWADRDDGRGSKPTLIKFDPRPGLVAGEPTTDAVINTDNSVPEFGSMRFHEGPVTWKIPIKVAADAKAGRYDLSGLIGYQACETRGDNMGSCELPKGARFRGAIDVGGDGGGAIVPVAFSSATYKEAALTAAGGNPSGIAFPSAEAGTPGAAPQAATSLVLILAAALLGGMILNLMPCVLPVIGLKVLAFAEQGGEKRRRILMLNLAYSAGLILVFLVLATLASLAQLGIGSTEYGWGELYTMLWFKVAMIVLVFAMALSFLGVWEIPIPGFAGSGTAARLATREGYGGAVAKGIFTTILATPCSGPFLGPVFGYTIGQPPWLTYLIFLFVGIGMASPYLLIGAAPSLVRWLPRPGEWMVTFKQLMGFLLLGTVVYLFSTIGAQYFIPTLALVVAVWFACWWIGRTPLTASDNARRAAWAGGVATAAVIGVVAFRMFTPGEFELPWQPYSQATLAQARTDGKTVMVDFTADWCPTCKTNLKLSLNRREVHDLVQQNGVLALVADWTESDPVIKQALAELGSRSIPLLAIYPADPQQQVIVLRDLVTQSEVVGALRQAGPSRVGSRVATIPIK
jgi:thiol:disulfide interchange protein/DsbC/DsbD-like thiol-disulfide interchange protein